MPASRPASLQRRDLRLNGRILGEPEHQELHRIIDGVCVHV